MCSSTSASVSSVSPREPFFEPEITTDLPQADKSIDYALAVRVASFLWRSQLRWRYQGSLLRQLLALPGDVEGDQREEEDDPERGAKIVIFVLQLLAALSVYVIMAHPAWCHDFRTCQRKTTCDPLEGGILSRMAFDYDIIGAVQRVEMISGAKKWRWQINTKTQMQFTKSGGKVYADLKFEVPNGAIENKVTTPGSGARTRSQARPNGKLLHQPRSSARESNQRHAFKSETGKWDWVAYNSSMYKFVARHDGGETSGDSTCFGANTQWWTDKGMFTSRPQNRRRRRRGKGWLRVHGKRVRHESKRQTAGLQRTARTRAAPSTASWNPRTSRHTRRTVGAVHQQHRDGPQPREF